MAAVTNVATPTPAATSPALELAGFGTFAAINAGDTITGVAVTIGEHQSDAGMAGVTFQLWTRRVGADRATAYGGASTAGVHTSTATWTGVTYAQLATLRVRVYGVQGSRLRPVPRNR